jgi:hypothetical protein
MFKNNAKRLSLLAAAISMAPLTSTYADVELYRTDGGGAIPGPSQDPQTEPSSDVQVTEDTRVYLHTAIEVEMMNYSDDPDGGSATDHFDNKLEFGVGAEFDQNWEAYFELKFGHLEDSERGTRVKEGRNAEIEVTNAWVNWEGDNLETRVGVWRPELAGDTRMWFREHLVGARLQYDFNNGVEGEIGSGVLSEDGNSFGEDKQITWATAKLGGFYATQGLFQYDPAGTAPTDYSYDPAVGPFGDLYNLAIGWEGELGPIDTVVEFNQNFGEAKTGQDYKGRAAYAEFSGKLGTNRPHLILAWGSGDDTPGDDEIGEYQEARSDLSLTKAMIDEGFVENISTNGSGGVNENKDGIGNIALFQIGNTFQLTPTWKAAATASYLTLAEDNANGDKYLGTEINFLNQWNLPTSRDVRVYLDLAYVFSGEAYGPDDVWLIEPGIKVTF